MPSYKKDLYECEKPKIVAATELFKMKIEIEQLFITKLNMSLFNENMVSEFYLEKILVGNDFPTILNIRIL